MGVLSLSELHVSNFKNFQSFDLQNLGNMTIFIGPNGIGKSNLLHVFSFLHELVSTDNQYSNQDIAIEDYFYQWDTKNNISIKAKFVNNDNNETYGYEVVIAKDNNGGVKILNEVFSNYSKNLVKEYNNEASNFKKLSIIEVEKNSVEEVMVYKFFKNMAGYNFYNHYAFLKTSTAKNNQNTGAFSDEYMDQLALLLNDIKKDSIFKFESIIKILKYNISTIEDITLEYKNSKLVAFCKSKFCKKSKELKYLSEGTKRLLALSIVLNLPTYLRPSLLILEEPEISMHPSLLDIIADLIQIYSNDHQVILVTHSSFLLNKLSSGNLYILKMDKFEEKTVVKEVDKNKIKRWLEEYSLGDLWLMNVIGN